MSLFRKTKSTPNLHQPREYKPHNVLEECLELECLIKDMMHKYIYMYWPYQHFWCPTPHTLQNSCRTQNQQIIKMPSTRTGQWYSARHSMPSSSTLRQGSYDSSLSLITSTSILRGLPPYRWQEQIPDITLSKYGKIISTACQPPVMRWAGEHCGCPGCSQLHHTWLSLHACVRQAAQIWSWALTDSTTMFTRFAPGMLTTNFFSFISMFNSR